MPFKWKLQLRMHLDVWSQTQSLASGNPWLSFPLDPLGKCACCEILMMSCLQELLLLLFSHLHNYIFSVANCNEQYSGQAKTCLPYWHKQSDGKPWHYSCEWTQQGVAHSLTAVALDFGEYSQCFTDSYVPNYWGAFSERTVIFLHVLLDCEFSLLARRCCYLLKKYFLNQNLTLYHVFRWWSDLCSSEFGVKASVHLCWPRSVLSRQGSGGSCWLWTAGYWDV